MIFDARSASAIRVAVTAARVETLPAFLLYSTDVNAMEFPGGSPAKVTGINPVTCGGSESDMSGMSGWEFRWLSIH